MKALPYWIQRADFSATDHPPVDVSTAIRAFGQHPWHEELTLQSKLEHQGGDYCPPGIGFMDPGGPILHVCPNADGRALVHYHTAGTQVHTREGVLQADVVELIHYFFHGQHDWILQRLGTA